jgi:two-component system, chemotaxis family, CheB/CheR fusion protein
MVRLPKAADFTFAAPPVPDTSPDLESLLDYLKRTRGFDFTGYKRTSLERRIAKRMQTVGAGGFSDYLDFLEVHPEEFEALFNTVLINVTHFFRDSSTWDFISETVVPELLSRREPTQPMRVWSAGCASGEEAYTLAMVFAEAMGLEAFRDRVKIYATDVDEEALAKARQAVYTEQEVAEIAPELLAKYFEQSEGNYIFRKDLRRHVIFGRHDLIQDAPISRVDMLVCRNTLMYFNAETQARILARFQFALNDGGVLFLGRAETLLTHTAAFAPIDLKRRISTKLPSPNGALRERLLAFAAQQNASGLEQTAQARLRELALDGTPTAQLLVDSAGVLSLANERARSLFGIAVTDVSRPIRDLKISYRPVELRSVIDQAFSDRRAVLMRDVEWPLLAGDVRWLDVHVLPLIDPLDGTILGASVTFTDVTNAKRLQRDLEHTNEELETAYEELQSTNEELETTNEELQSTVEELETTNEELQSTNEELETMNEELQSTNEELQTMNDELRIRSDELNSVNAFLESILTSLRGAVVVVDADLRLLVWNRGAEELWGLREDEVRGKHFLGLDIGLPTESLKNPIRACLNGTTAHTTVTLDAINRRGRNIVCVVNLAPLVTPANAIHGAILHMEEMPQPAIVDGDGQSLKPRRVPTEPSRKTR